MTQVTIKVMDQHGAALAGVPVSVEDGPSGQTDADGVVELEVEPGKKHTFKSSAFKQTRQATVEVGTDPEEIVLQHEFDLQIVAADPVSFQTPLAFARRGDVIGLDYTFDNRITAAANTEATWSVQAGDVLDADQPGRKLWSTAGAGGSQKMTLTLTDRDTGASFSTERTFFVSPEPGLTTPVDVNLTRTQFPETEDQALWVAIRNGSKAIGFANYTAFVDSVLCAAEPYTPGVPGHLVTSPSKQAVYGTGAYELLKTATQIFLLLECSPLIVDKGSFSGEQLYDPAEEKRRLGRELSLGQIRTELQNYLGSGRLPYIDRVLDTAFQGVNEVDRVFCTGYIAERAECRPMIELIWSYWHEEAMLEQTMNALSLRFQNIGRGKRDPLAHLEIAPLYPVNNLLWGFIEGEDDRLSVPRRNYEYSHHYGLRLFGQAISDFRPADPRSQFIEAFHNLLYQSIQFYKQDDDKTYSADAFPVLNALRETHLILAEGAHNQFGDLPWTARAEMLTEQWILSRPETRLFLQSRDMVPYREEWMPQVDTMKRIQGWNDVSVTHFNFLAVYGEQLLLSIRYGDWIDVTEPANAANWAKYWRPEIQGYIHAYRAATGVDLAAESSDGRQTKLRATPPPVLLQQRSQNGRNGGRSVATPAPRFRQRRTERRKQNGQ